MEEQVAERERTGGGKREQRLVEDGDTAVGQVVAGSTPYPGDACVAFDVEIGSLPAGGLRRQYQVCLVRPRLAQVGEPVVRPNVAVQNDKGTGRQVWQGTVDAAAGVEEFRLRAVAYANAQIGAGTQGPFDLCAQVVEVDHDLLDARPVQPTNLVDDQGLAANR